MASDFFGRQHECRFYTAGCGNKMVVSVTGPRAVNELGGPVIPGTLTICYSTRYDWAWAALLRCHQGNVTDLTLTNNMEFDA